MPSEIWKLTPTTAIYELVFSEGPSYSNGMREAKKLPILLLGSCPWVPLFLCSSFLSFPLFAPLANFLFVRRFSLAFGLSGALMLIADGAHSPRTTNITAESNWPFGFGEQNCTTQGLLVPTPVRESS